MNPTRLRASWVLGGLLVLALGGLILVLARGIPYTTPVPTEDATSPGATATQHSAEGALLPLSTVDPTLAAIVRPSLPQEWASAIIASADEHQIGLSDLAQADFAWLQQKGLWGRLAHDATGMTIGGQALSLAGRTTVEIVVPAASAPGGLQSIGRIEHRDNALTLLLSAEAGASQSVRSLAGAVPPDDVLAALSQEASARQLALLVAYWETPGGGAILVIVDLVAVSQAMQGTDFAFQGTPTLTPTGVTATPSPTLSYQPQIGLTLEPALVQFIETTQRASAARRAAAITYAQDHAWAGILTWDDEISGPLVAGRPLDLHPDTADQLTVFELAQAGPSLTPVTLLQAGWDGSGTTVSDRDGASQWYYGYRLGEIIHGLVQVAGQHDGQLTVTHDEIGSYRALTIVDFQPLPLPPDG